MGRIFSQGKLVQPQATSRPNAKQPLRQSVHAVEIPDALLKIQTVCAVTGLSESSIYRKLAAGDFPTPIKDGSRCTRWRAGMVTEWLRARGATAA